MPGSRPGGESDEGRERRSDETRDTLTGPRLTGLALGFLRGAFEHDRP